MPRRRTGWVWCMKLVDADTLEQRVQAMLATLRLGGPQAQAHCKWLLAELRGRDPTLESIEETARSLASVRAGEEGARGHRGVLRARRKPVCTVATTVAVRAIRMRRRTPPCSTKS